MSIYASNCALVSQVSNLMFNKGGQYRKHKKKSQFCFQDRFGAAHQYFRLYQDLLRSRYAKNEQQALVALHSACDLNPFQFECAPLQAATLLPHIKLLTQSINPVKIFKDWRDKLEKWYEHGFVFFSKVDVCI